jgi:hypothetical protein
LLRERGRQAGWLSLVEYELVLVRAGEGAAEGDGSGEGVQKRGGGMLKWEGLKRAAVA